jgi:hypothetical protein
MRTLREGGEVFVAASDITAAMRALALGYQSIATESCCEEHGDGYAMVSEELASLADRLDCVAIYSINPLDFTVADVGKFLT